ncbi:MAG: hypothetical protein C4523_06475 [Myxococcales bacterium]|nr:MAG: hypothetical protein C4523_06475 [Myxococcales bacterium]
MEKIEAIGVSAIWQARQKGIVMNSRKCSPGVYTALLLILLLGPVILAGCSGENATQSIIDGDLDDVDAIEFEWLEENPGEDDSESGHVNCGSDQCGIDGGCVSRGSQHPDHGCLMCDPERNARAWSLAREGTVCREAVGDCDLAELCDGENQNCTEDGVMSSATLCRDSAGDCDLAEYCDGADKECPNNRYMSENELCRDADGPCDIGEFCTGDSPNCPPDRLLQATILCRLYHGACDAVEYCDGLSKLCPEDFPDADGSICDDGNVCTVGDYCAEGRCLAGESEKDLDRDGLLDWICGGDDCNDEDDEIYPGATDVCDGKDNDCDPESLDGSAEEPFDSACDAETYPPGRMRCIAGEWTCEKPAWYVLSPPFVRAFNSFSYFGEAGIAYDSFLGYAFVNADEGETWHVQITDTPQILEKVYFLSATRAIGVGYGEVYRTENGGVAWGPSQMEDDIQISDVHIVGETAWAFGSAAYQRARILKSVDGGATWTVLYQGDEERPTSVSSGYFIDESTGWALGGEKLLATTSGGETWTVTELTFQHCGNQVYFANATTGFIFGETYNSPCDLWRTEDGGQTWSSISLSADTTLETGVRDIMFTTETTGWIADKSGLYKTEDGGLTWAMQVVPVPSEGLVKLSRSASGILYAGGGSFLFRSRDDGENWEKQHGTIPNYVLDYAFLDTENILAVGLGMTKSTDGGSTWERLEPKQPWIPSINFINELQGWYFMNLGTATEAAGAVFYTDDGGGSWEKINETPIEIGIINDRLSNIQFVNEKDGWLLIGSYEEGCLYRTTDGGHFWEELTSSLSDVYGMDFVTETVGYMASFTGVYKSVDGGETWSLVLAESTLDVDFLDAQNGWAVGRGPVYFTNDGGQTWHATWPDGKAALAIGDTWYSNMTKIKVFSVEHAWIAFNGKTIISTTDGQIWRLREPEGFSLRRTGSPFLFCPPMLFDRETGFLFDSRGVVWKTETGGK